MSPYLTPRMLDPWGTPCSCVRVYLALWSWMVSCCSLILLFALLTSPLISPNNLSSSIDPLVCHHTVPRQYSSLVAPHNGRFYHYSCCQWVWRYVLVAWSAIRLVDVRGVWSTDLQRSLPRLSGTCNQLALANRYIPVRRLGLRQKTSGSRAVLIFISLLQVIQP